MSERPAGGPGVLLLIAGVVFPSAVIAFELVTRWCAAGYFDPIPTWWHTGLVALVPATNLALWWQLRTGKLGDGRWLAIAGGMSVAIAAFYSIVFLPVMPLAVMLVIFYGIGLLPFGPVAALVAAGVLSRRLRVRQGMMGISTRSFWAGLAAGVAALVLVDLPAGLTRLGVQWAASNDPAERARGIGLLRRFGDENTLLRLCYEASGRISGPVGFVVTVMRSGNRFPEGRPVASTDVVREIFYRVTGEPFNARPVPFTAGPWARLADIAPDLDQGGTTIGGRVRGLDLVTSKLDGHIDGDGAVGYLEWVLEFRNTSTQMREARLQIGLPPQAVVSRVTLWINGEEREAAFGGKGQVRAAYERVVRRRMDPLLVTTQGADRALAQAFPIMPNGGTMKVRVGMTVPLELVDAGKARLVLPAILERNFGLGSDVRHALWLESKRPLGFAHDKIAAAKVGDALHRIAGDIADSELARDRRIVTVERDAAAAKTVARYSEGPHIVQEIAARPAKPSGAVMLVVDGSKRVARHLDGLIAALDRVPEGAKVGLMVAADGGARVPMAPWSAAQKQAFASALRQAPFVGGEDNAPALADALIALEAHADAQVLWLHGPQPVRLREHGARLEQASTRIRQPARLWLYQLDPGPNELLPDNPVAWGASTLPRTGGTAAAIGNDLGEHLRKAFATAPVWSIERSRHEGSEAPDGIAKGSAHIARLWARDEVLRAIAATGRKPAPPAAVELAVAHQLVTPVSGAVVLETQQQYDEATLKPVNPATVPTVPEPRVWALLALVLALLTWLAWRGRRVGMA
jgi:hypothetical protein